MLPNTTQHSLCAGAIDSGVVGNGVRERYYIEQRHGEQFGLLLGNVHPADHQRLNGVPLREGEAICMILAIDESRVLSTVMILPGDSAAEVEGFDRMRPQNPGLGFEPMTFGGSIEDGYALPSRHCSIFLHLHRVFVNAGGPSTPVVALPSGATSITANCRREATIEIMVHTRESLDSQGVTSDRVRGIVTVCRGLLAGRVLEGVPPEEYPDLEVDEDDKSGYGLTVRVL